MHPAIWNIPHRLEKLLTCLLGDGYGLLSAFWAWRLAPGTASCGWPPHRDRAGITVQKDGTPNSITVWIALTNATPENGCIYVVPPECDPYYGGAASSVDVHDVQNVRAIPAQAGRALAWNHQLLHWGGTIARATEARVSIAFEFRRADALDTTDTIDRGRIPGFADRLKLIARQILEYKRFESIDRRFVDLATQLLSRGPADTPP
jgi:ectoine hydroxylase-related dioxygenase (phytanoyl-CoA dioxygenase family)